jgi:hypothetical protein
MRVLNSIDEVQRGKIPVRIHEQVQERLGFTRASTDCYTPCGAGNIERHFESVNVRLILYQPFP